MNGEIIASIISIIISAIVGPVCVLLVTSRLKRSELNQKMAEEEREKSEERIREGLKKERREEITEIVSSVISEKTVPLTDEVKSIEHKLDKVADGTLSTLRNDILTCYYKCVDKGYRNDYDYQNVHHMFDSYRELNGNSYVADVVERFDKLPTKEEWEKKKKASIAKKKSLPKTKKVLVEDK